MYKVEELHDILFDQDISYLIDDKKDFTLFMKAYTDTVFFKLKRFLQDHKWDKYFSIDRKEKMFVSNGNVLDLGKEDPDFQEQFVDEIIYERKPKRESFFKPGENKIIKISSIAVKVVAIGFLLLLILSFIMKMF